MADSNQVTPIRGAIKTSVSTSTDGLVAGQEFSIFVTVQNPFEVPLALHRISTYLPTEFLDIDKRLRDYQRVSLEEQLIELDDAARSLGLSPTGALRLSQSGFEKFLRKVGRISLRTLGIEIDFRPGSELAPAIARDVAGETEIRFGVSLPLIGNITQIIKKKSKNKEDLEAERAALREVVAGEITKYKEAVKALEMADTTSKSLQAGNSTTRVFTLRSRRSVWFRPATYRLHIEVEYEIAGVRNVDTIEHSLQVKASLISMVLGALLAG